MTAATVSTTVLAQESKRLAGTLVRWLETGVRPDDLFADDVFLDLSLPQWRLQETTADGAFGIRDAEHPHPGQVRVEGLDQTSRGFLLRFDERWQAEGQTWYSRELIHCVVTGGRISELIVYCTGDWDAAVQRRHDEQVRLVRR
jgi:hypothetical protein